VHNLSTHDAVMTSCLGRCQRLLLNQSINHSINQSLGL